MDLKHFYYECLVLIFLLCADGRLCFFEDDYDDTPSFGRCPWIRNKLKNGRVKIRSRGRIAKFLCDPGYELAGKRFATCVRGQWNNPIPVCVARGCSRVPTVTNGRVTEMYRGALLVYDCNPGYTLDGVVSIYCDGRRWSTDPPTCVVTTSDPETTCDFEDPDLCGWNHDPTHDFDWKRNQFSTPSGHVGTGPSYDHTFGPGKGGFYLYLEASSPRKVNDTSRLFSPVYPPDYSGGCFIFWYHMYGATTGGLRVYIKRESHVFGEVYASWELYGEQGNEWRRGNIAIPALQENFQIVIEGIRGNSYVGDTAIDDVKLTKNDCKSMENTTEPVAHTVAESCRGRCREPDEETSCGCNENCIAYDNCCNDYSTICTTGNDTSAENPDEPSDDDLGKTSSPVTVTIPKNLSTEPETQQTTITTEIKSTPTKSTTEIISTATKSTTEIRSTPTNSTSEPATEPTMTSTPISEMTEPTTIIKLSTYPLTTEPTTSSVIAVSSTTTTPLVTTQSSTSVDRPIKPPPTQATTKTTSVKTSSTRPNTVSSTTSTTSKTTTTEAAATVIVTTEVTSTSTSTTVLPNTTTSTTQTIPVTIVLNNTTHVNISITSSDNFTNSSTLSTTKRYNLRPRSSTTVTPTSTTLQTNSTFAVPTSPTSTTTMNSSTVAFSSSSVLISSANTTEFKTTPTSSTTKWFNNITVPAVFTRSSKAVTTQSSSTATTAAPTVRSSTRSTITTTPISRFIRTTKLTYDTSTSTSKTLFPVTTDSQKNRASKLESEGNGSQPNVTIISVSIVVIICIAGGLFYYLRKQKSKRQSKLSDDSEMRFLSENEVMEYSDASGLEKILT